MNECVYSRSLIPHVYVTKQFRMFKFHKNLRKKSHFVKEHLKVTTLCKELEEIVDIFGCIKFLTQKIAISHTKNA